MNFAVQKSYQRRPKLIESGDLVVVYERHDALDHVYMEAGKILHNKFGTFPHDDIIGKPFGSKIYSKSSSGYVYALEPSPELWSSAVHTRTQIVNEVDSSVVTLLLDVYPGCKVVESGTGSGCMTLSLIRAVYPLGHVYTFEYNNFRAQEAREEFKRLKVDDYVTVTHKDVCGKYLDNEGGFTGVSDKDIDAVFLDLPEPWLALHHAKRVLKPGRNICCYSPCMEQVMKTCEKLRELNFHNIRMIEVRQRPYDGRVIEMETLDMGLSKDEEVLNNFSARDPKSQHHKEKTFKTILDTPSSSSKTTQNQVKKNSSENNNKKRKFNPKEENNNDENSEKDNEDEVEEEDEDKECGEPDLPNSLINRIKNCPKPSVNGAYSMHCARPVSTMKSHTAFLTFASRSLSD